MKQTDQRLHIHFTLGTTVPPWLCSIRLCQFGYVNLAMSTLSINLVISIRPIDRVPKSTLYTDLNPKHMN